ncbi:hypothetical protein CTAYLR_000169 [Chrysophaeum taylorii]|uniref:oligopeptidase A n=1 Tax=Chrysophaeum taylorii TaxID=2483200 RepID=A0AAD7UIL6_9STRA|nr:hypothetical protein CTAYLR_000169 [Chrysophaeum taylorii]
MASVLGSSNNALLEQESLPKFSRIEVSQVVPGVSSLLEEMEGKVSGLEFKPTYEDTVEAVEKASARLFYAWGVVGHLNGVNNSEELRAAFAEMQPKVVEATTKLGQSKPLFEALEGVEETGARKRAVDMNSRQMRLGGVGLEGAAKQEFNANKMRLSKLATDFSNNVLDATKWELVLEDASGLPESARALAAERAKKKHPEATADAGPWVVSLDIPSYLPAMKHLQDESVRETLYKAYIGRAGAQNAELMDEILELRRRQAELLGFETFADMSLSAKMADLEGVDELHELLASKAVPAAKRDLRDLEAFAGRELKHWDVAYYSERMREDMGVDEEALRPYFALDGVLEGLFGLIERLFGVVVMEENDGIIEVWHPDVRFFGVYEKEKKIAAFYLDPYSRPETKRSGAWMDVCVGKSKAVEREHPVAYLTCNGSPPAGGKPSLMTFSEVETLYHEMGHGLQHMLTKVDDGEVAGINGIEWDAVELPSQFMENFLLHKPTLYSFAKHYETGEPLPEDAFAKLKKVKKFQAGMMMARQIAFGALDIELHARYDNNNESLFEVQNRIFKKYLPMAPLEPDDKFLASFSHIFALSYSSAYYSYKWAEVMSADAFAAFEEAGLDDDDDDDDADLLREIGMRFRNTVLALGGSEHPADVYRKFRGKPPTVDALLRHSGLLLLDDTEEEESFSSSSG